MSSAAGIWTERRHGTTAAANVLMRQTAGCVGAYCPPKGSAPRAVVACRLGGIGGGVKGKKAGEEEREVKDEESHHGRQAQKVMSVVKVIYLFLRRSGWSTL